MTIVTTFEQTGDPKATMKLAEKNPLPASRRHDATEGQISAAAVRTETGVMLVEMWDIEEDMRRAAKRIGRLHRHDRDHAQRARRCGRYQPAPRPPHATRR